MKFKRCAACGAKFAPRPQAPTQSYCAAPECQRERRSDWQRDKLASDPDYRDNQIRANRAWAGRNTGYWRDYREGNPGYADRNRALQRGRNDKRQPRLIAKKDVSNASLALRSGIYALRLVAFPRIAKMDAWIVEIREHPCGCTDPDCDCKERT